MPKDEELHQIRTDVALIRERIQNLCDKTEERHEWHKERMDELAKLVNSHERVKYWFLGAAAGMGALGSKLVSLFANGNPPKP